MSVTTTYAVQGMTCDHCVRAVTHEVSSLDDVVEVRVDLAAGTVAVESTRPLEVANVRGAVEEAGYVLR